MLRLPGLHLLCAGLQDGVQIAVLVDDQQIPVQGIGLHLVVIADPGLLGGGQVAVLLALPDNIAHVAPGVFLVLAKVAVQGEHGVLRLGNFEAVHLVIL